MDWVRAHGTIVQTGMRLAPMRLDLTPAWYQEVNILGAIGHGTESWPGNIGLSTWAGDNGGRVSTFALAAALMREQHLTPHRFVTHRFPLTEIRRAVETAQNKAIHHSVKVLLDIRDVSSTRTRELAAGLRELGG